MIRICKWCNDTIEYANPKQFGAHLTNCKMNPSKIERDQLLTKRKERKLKCECGIEYSVKITEHEYEIGKFKKYCSRSCSSKYKIHSDKTKSKISDSLKKFNSSNPRPKNPTSKKCINCESIFNTYTKNRKYCSRKCAIHNTDVLSKMGKKGGLKSVQSQQRRSKNEIAFADLISKKYEIITNEPIFNGWDADIIIPSLKIAILWNGKWHYDKISKSQSLNQIQNRDRIKVEEIVKSGYTPYIIKDMGKFDLSKVNKEWEILQEYLTTKS